jgi:transcriptional regulator with XRE-family HTH domain
MRLGEKLPLYCAQRGWRLADLARLARMDVRTLYAMTARGTRSSPFAPKIADALGISVDELLEEAPPRPRHSPRAEEPRPTYGNETLDPIEKQLLGLFRGCRPNRRDDLLAMANTWYVEAHPGPSPANPFAEVRDPSAPRIAPTQSKPRATRR